MNNLEIPNLKPEILPPDCSTAKATLGRIVSLLLAALLPTFAALAQSTAFTYQGRLNHADSPATGEYEITFTLYDSMTSGNVIGTPITLAPIPVTNGLFTASLDFGPNAFSGAPRWLELSVTVFGSDQPVVTLQPRQPITSTPYSLHAMNASSVTGLSNAPVKIIVNGQPAFQLEPHTNAPNIVGGFYQNYVVAGVWGATIAGGGGAYGTGSSFQFLKNVVFDDMGFVGGGAGNGAGLFAVVSGGFSNRCHGWHGVIGGGALNFNSSTAGVIAGGARNFMDRSYSAILGGESIYISADHSSILGGLSNRVFSDLCSISGGWDNSIDTVAARSSIVGGAHNRIHTYAESSHIGGGELNEVRASRSIVGGGQQNVIKQFSEGSIIGGGLGNVVQTSCRYVLIGGGSGNVIQQEENTPFLFDSGSIIGGGGGNLIAGTGICIVGGSRNTNLAYMSFIGGGSQNLIERFASFSTVAGGANNKIARSSPYTTIAGGASNSVETNAAYTVISGGFSNSVSTNALASTIAGGVFNRIDDRSACSVISGGTNNRALPGSLFATIPGGSGNLAAAPYTMAAGRRANARHSGAYVWADSSGSEFPSTTTNEFSARATGGVRFVTAIDTNGTPSAGVSLTPGSGTWSSLSDRNAKENFTPTEPREVLNKVAALPIATWNYKSQDKSIRHIGPTAQDFHAAFNIGESDRTITTVDADGVALAAIQGLNQKLEAELKTKDAQIRQLQADLAEVKQLLHALANR